MNYPYERKRIWKKIVHMRTAREHNRGEVRIIDLECGHQTRQGVSRHVASGDKGMLCLKCEAEKKRLSGRPMGDVDYRPLRIDGPVASR